jgi:hypothetical protein
VDNKTIEILVFENSDSTEVLSSTFFQLLLIQVNWIWDRKEYPEYKIYVKIEQSIKRGNTVNNMIFSSK